MDTAESIFEHARRLGKVAIERWVREGYREDLHLDFKRKTHPRTSRLNDFDRRNYSKALSGFANSDGGIIVWGIDAPGSGSNKRAKHPIANVNGFAEFLDSFISRLVSPSIDGAINHVIYENEARKIGYVLSYVPRSLNAPHRAECEGLKQYYKRYGDSFKPIEHYELEYMFGLRRFPDLRLIWDAEIVDLEDKHEKHNDTVKVAMRIGLGNRGKAIGQYSCLRVRFDPKGEYRLDEDYQSDLIDYSVITRASRPHFVKLTARAKQGLVVYPEDHIYFMTFVAEYSMQQINERDLQDFFVVYDLFAQDFKAVIGQELRVSGKKVADSIKRKIAGDIRLSAS